MYKQRSRAIVIALASVLTATGVGAVATAAIPATRGTAVPAVTARVTASSPQWAGIRGASIQLFYGTRYDTAAFTTSLYSLKATGADAVSLVVQIGSTPIPSDTKNKAFKTDALHGFDDSSAVAAIQRNTPLTTNLKQAIVAAHNAGLAVMLDVHVEPHIKNGWRGRSQPIDVTRWFGDYEKQLASYATLAQHTHIEYFELGTELVQLSGAPAVGKTKARSQQLEGLWEHLIAHVRKDYKGKLVYIAQWDGSEDKNIHFLKDLDYIGIGGYKPLTAPGAVYTQAHALAALASWDRSVVEPLLKLVKQEHSKAKLLLGEFGYRSIADADVTPSAYVNNIGSYDAEGQAADYDDDLSYWAGHANLAGGFLWDWPSDISADSPADKSFHPDNKPAEGVLRLAWKALHTLCIAYPAAPGHSCAAPSDPAVTFSQYTPTQPLKAALYGWPLGSYTMTWQLDSGAAQTLTDTPAEGEKEGIAAVATWTTGLHTLTFTASDSLGAVIQQATTSVIVTPAISPTTSGPIASSSPSQTSTPIGAASSSTGTPTGTPVSTATASPSGSSTADPTVTSYGVVEDTPAPGATLSGTVTFEGRLVAHHTDGTTTNVDPADYWLYWEADTGPNITKMSDTPDANNDKTASVDMSGFTYSSTNSYTISMIAIDRDGSYLAATQNHITANAPKN